MKDVLTYKSFIGSVHFSNSDKVFHGKLEGINDLITFEGRSVSELTTSRGRKRLFGALQRGRKRS
jgi:predicted HicB family RNase H-like nuclease